MMQAEYLQRFARVALAGLNLQRGQSLAIKMEPEHAEIAAVVAEHAYRAGARYVDIWAESTRFLRSRLDHSLPEHLDYVPEHRALRNAEFLRDGWALLSLKGPIDPAVMEGADAERSGRINRVVSSVDAPLRRALATDETQWLVMAPPSPKWASRVIGISDGTAALAAMWEALVPVLRLNEDDPAAFWKRHGAGLKERAATLNDLQIRSLRFRDDGTDLDVPLHASARWIGGGATTQGGVDFSPNIPTEEVFTAPNAPKVSGRVAITRPVRVLGGLVRDGWFEFRDGAVVDYGATSGGDHLAAFLSVDEGSRSIGEIALVDSSSPIYQTGLVFENILLDENAACHFALGAAYPTCIAGGARMDDDELIAHGANRSRQHVDFMFGSDDIEVSAVAADGETVPIMKKGRFAL
ncbi:MAG: aminopeptidase [Spirochaeta sp.]|jgi:aminopeptidase|nr:aminopeptidase [Spirochaeta sp.]